MTRKLKIQLRASHVRSKVRVKREHVFVAWGLCALLSKFETDALPPDVQPFHGECSQGPLVASVALTKNDGESFLLNQVVSFAPASVQSETQGKRTRA